MGRDGAVSQRVAFLMPGQGSQAPRMLGGLARCWPRFAEELTRLDQRWPHLDGRSIKTHISEDDADQLRDTRVAQPALGLVCCAAARALLEQGVVPWAFAGHSYGELVALHLGGAFDEQGLGTISVTRGRIWAEASQAVSGGMLALGCSRQQAEALIAGVSEAALANENAPNQVVISGDWAALDTVAGRAAESGVSSQRLATSGPFHSPLMASMEGRWREALEAMEIAPLEGRVLCSATSKPYPADPDAIRDGLLRQLTTGLSWVAQIEELYAQGVRVFLEVGPGKVLSGLTKRILGGRPHRLLCLDPGKTPAAEHLADILTSVSPRSSDFDTVQSGSTGKDDAGPSVGREAFMTSCRQLVEVAQGNAQVVEAFYELQSELARRWQPSEESRPEVLARHLESNVMIAKDFLATQKEIVLRLGGDPAAPSLAEGRGERQELAAEIPVVPTPASQGGSCSTVAPPRNESPDLSPPVEKWLCRTVAELTGLPEEEVRPSSNFENDFGTRLHFIDGALRQARRCVSRTRGKDEEGA